MSRAKPGSVFSEWTVVAATMMLVMTIGGLAQTAPQTFAGGGTSSNHEYELTGTIGRMEDSPPMTGEDIEVTGQVTSMMLTVPAPDGTVLTISVTPENNVVISWPSDGSDLVLQETSNLGAPSWTTVNNPPTDDGFTKTVTLPLGAGNKFFRLKKP
jgi:hypothetical protein